MAETEKNRATIMAYLSQKLSACRADLWSYLDSELDATALESNLDDIIYILVNSLPPEIISYAEGMMLMDNE